jgi:large subunit ribosomal protein L19
MDMKSAVTVKANPIIPELAPGDTVKVSSRIVEGDKERIQNFQGVIIRIRKNIATGSFTVRRSTMGVGVERTFFFQSPMVAKIEVVRHGKVRRSRLYYLRLLSAKESRLKERQKLLAEEAGAAVAAPAAESAAPAAAETTSPPVVTEAPKS